MKKLLLGVSVLVLMYGAFQGGIYNAKQQPSFGGTAVEDEAAKKYAVMADYVWLNARLNQPPTIDIAVASTEEWATAYMVAIEKYQVPVPVDKTEPTDLNEAMKEKASQLQVFCSDPTATKEEAAEVIKK